MGMRFEDRHHHSGNDDTTLTFDDYLLFVGDHPSDRFAGLDDQMNVAFGRDGKDRLIGGPKRSRRDQTADPLSASRLRTIIIAPWRISC